MKGNSNNRDNQGSTGLKASILRAQGFGLFSLCLQLLLTVGILFMSVTVRLPLGCLLALGILGIITTLANLSRDVESSGCVDSICAPEGPKAIQWRCICSARIAQWGWLLVWIAGVMAAASLWLARKRFDFISAWDTYYAVLVGMSASVLGVTAARVEQRCKRGWCVITLFCALFACALWLGAMYLRNQVAGFYAALVGTATVLVTWQLWLRPGASLRLLLNTCILLLAVLPFADLFRASDSSLQRDPEVRKEYYSYAAAKKDPTAFARWWDYYLDQWAKTERAIVAPDPEGYLPFRLRPNSHSVLMQCPIVINSLGFRGAEISKEKGDAYRIIALGESTTFGITLSKDDRPWPELLQELIRQRLKTARPIEVINAGVFGYSLNSNVHRFPKDILPLQPDMIISYHGINGFPMLSDAMPSRLRQRPPAYRERPIRLLGDCEYRFRLLLYRHHQQSRLALHPPKLSNPLDTGYARDYERLVELARTNSIRLVLANYSMAVNDRSDRDVIRFYQVGYPAARWQVQANALHSRIVHEIARRHPEVCFLDSQPRLDGEPEKFIDLVHFAPEGERQMAETVFAGIRSILEADLRSASGLRESGGGG